MKNTILQQDCKETLADNSIKYDYLFCVPPDYDELNLDPDCDNVRYQNFLYDTFSLFKPSKNVVTIAITDRKYKGGILTKHYDIISIMSSLGYKYIAQKIWCKSYKRNLYRLNYSFIMSFGKGEYKQNHNELFEEDVWNAHVYRHMGYNYAIALEVVKRCIANFTGEGDIVYDAFMGSGTTAIACLETGRNYIGSEINKKYCKIAEDRIKTYYDKEKKLL